jgi:hypothetical protein
MEDGRLELVQQTGMVQTGMMAVYATRQAEMAGRSTRTADVWRQFTAMAQGTAEIPLTDRTTCQKFA